MTSGVTSISGHTSTPLSFPGLQVSAVGNPTVTVRLSVLHGLLHMQGTIGLTMLYGSYLSDKSESFSGSLTDVNAALAALTYTRSEEGTDSLAAYISSDVNLIYNPLNGHYYEQVSNLLSWADAKTDAHSRTTGGVSGYLATLTSADESTFIKSNFRASNAWVGASDAATEGNWQWVDGPETGTQFWSGGPSGHAVNGQYANWSLNEPSEAAGKNCAAINDPDGNENLLADGCAGTYGYLVEYGAPGALPTPPSFVSIGITTKNVTDIVTSCAQLNALGQNTNTRGDTIKLANDIDCTGIDFQPMYLGAAFYGTFSGHYHKISNLTISKPATESVGLFSMLKRATVENLTLTSGSVHGGNQVGSLAGYAVNSFISNVVSHVNVTADTDSAGGLLGGFAMENNDGLGTTGNLTYLASSGTVHAGNETAGGLLGFLTVNSASTLVLSKCSSTGAVTIGLDTDGGLIGSLTIASGGVATVTIQDCYVQSDVTAPSYAGGLIGSLAVNSGGGGGDLATLNLQRVYASGTLTASSYVGGFVATGGYFPNAQSVVNISNSFVASPLMGDDPSTTAVVVGYSGSGDHGFNTSNIYYDQTRVGNSTCANNDTESCTAVNTDGSQPDYFKNNATNPPLNSWDFSTIWASQAALYPEIIQPPVPTDDDADGVPDTVENAAPNGGDANSNGIPDSFEANVTSFVSSLTGTYVTLQVDDTCAVTAASMVAGSSEPKQDSAFRYPVGLMNFTAACGTPGHTSTIAHYYHGVTTTGLAGRKYSAGNQSYSAIPGAVISQVSIGGQTVTKLVYQVTDGSSFDEDATANGTIVDPAGLGLAIVSAPKTGIQ